MRLVKTVSVEELQVASRFEGLRKLLLSEPYADHLDKPLAYWALPTDRRLPLAFLGRRLRDLLSVPFVDLSATPGIGRKKMGSFVQLLARAANTDPALLPAETIDPQSNGMPSGARSGRQRRIRSDEYLRGDVGPVAQQRDAPWPGRRAPRPASPQSAEHDAGHLEHSAGRLHEFHPGRNPRHEDARREAHSRPVGSLPRRPYHRGRHGHSGTSGHSHRSALDRSSRAMDRPGVAAAGHPQPAGNLGQLRLPVAGTDPHRRYATDRHAGREPAGHQRPDHQRAASGADHGPYPRPRLPTPQRDQRHHDRSLADGAASVP